METPRGEKKRRIQNNVTYAAGSGTLYSHGPSFLPQGVVTWQETCICATECVLLPGYLVGPVLVDAIDLNAMCRQ